MQSVERLCRQYRQRLEVNRLSWPPAHSLDQEDAQETIFQSMQSMQNDGNDSEYDKRFLRNLFDRLDGPVCSQAGPRHTTRSSYLQGTHIGTVRRSV